MIVGIHSLDKLALIWLRWQKEDLGILLSTILWIIYQAACKWLWWFVLISQLVMEFKLNPPLCTILQSTKRVNMSKPSIKSAVSF